ncbi:MAG TPA: hypothetical protein PKA64_03775, partial [Myxococcota bacterium]|nr:hypothetical protein [Myxococcota bacterium]
MSDLSLIVRSSRVVTRVTRFGALALALAGCPKRGPKPPAADEPQAAPATADTHHLIDKAALA